MIPPPCPRNIDGKGVVDNITVIDPGNGFTPPPPGPPDPDSGSFPVSLELDSVTSLVIQSTITVELIRL